MAAALSATSLTPTPKFSNAGKNLNELRMLSISKSDHSNSHLQMMVAEINDLFQNLFDDSDPDNAGRSKNGGEGPSEEEVASCLDQLVPGRHSPSKTQVDNCPEISLNATIVQP